MMNTSQYNRRQFIASSMAMIPLPFMQSLMAGPSSQVLRTPAEAKRMVFLGMGFGVTKSAWFPDLSERGGDYTLPEGLQPLARHKDGFSIIQNLTHQFSRNGHSGSTFWLTGANQYAVSGKSFHNTISVDQVAAEQLGLETRYSSMQFSGKKLEGADSGHGKGLSLSWDRAGKPMSAIETPNDVFHRMFSNPNVSIEQQKAELEKRRSVLDTVFKDVQSLRRKLNYDDRDKLEEYVQSLRDIETRISKEESWIGVPKKMPQQALEEPSTSLKGKEEIRIMYDLMVAAMQVDATRVMSYRMPADTFLQSIGVGSSSHGLSHYREHMDKERQMSIKRDVAHTELLAEFFDKLKASKEANGKSLFDNTTITFGGNISSRHNLDNCPTLVAGGGALKVQGQNYVAKEAGTPLCNLWLSILQGSGVNVDHFGDSSGVLPGLV